MTDNSFFEKLIYNLADKAKKNKSELCTSIIIGFLSYGFMLSNKLIQQDDAAAMFAKGTSLTAGRWGLEITSLIFPDVSMPWIYGILSIIILGVSACIIIDIFNIDNMVLRCMFCILFISSPSILGIFTQPYLSTSNSLSILFSVIAVLQFTHSTYNPKKIILGIILLILSLSIYQAYITLVASLLVVFLIKQLIVNKLSAKNTFNLALLLLGYLIASLAVYGFITLLINKILGVELLSYAASKVGLLKRLRVTYSSFAGYFIKGYYSLIPDFVSLGANIILVVISIVYIIKATHTFGKYEKILTIILIVMLPLAVNSMYLVASPDIFSAIVFLGYTSCYLLVAVLFDNTKPNTRGYILTLLAVVAISNIYFANKVSLKMYMQTSQTKAFYEGIMNRVTSLDEYCNGDIIAIIGDETGQSYIFDEIDTSNFIGLTAEDSYNIYTRDRFIELYLGYTGPFASFDNKYYISTLEEFKEMPTYPEKGSVKKINDTIVVKLE